MPRPRAPTDFVMALNVYLEELEDEREELLNKQEEEETEERAILIGKLEFELLTVEAALDILGAW